MLDAEHLPSPAGRPTVAVGLRGSEQELVAQELAEAGFGTVLIDGPREVAEAIALGRRPTVAILDVTADPEVAPRIMADLARAGTPVAALYVADDATLTRLEAAGITESDEIVLRPCSTDSLRWRVEAMVIRSQSTSTDSTDALLRTGALDFDWVPRSPIFAIFNPKGGVGKTTIATNLAAALQLRKARRVLLVDADTVTGHVVLSLGIEAGRTVSDSWADEMPGDARESILDLASEHGSGIKVAALTSSPLALPNLDPERVADALLEARSGVDAIIVDLHPSYSEVNLAVFAVSDRILVPVTPDLPAIRAALQLTEVATELGVRDRLAMIINRANSGVSVADIERATGMRSLAEIRSAGLQLVWAANAGRTLIEKYPREKVTDDFDRLAERLLDVSGRVVRESTAPRRSVFGLFGRKVGAGA